MAVAIRPWTRDWQFSAKRRHRCAMRSSDIIHSRSFEIRMPTTRSKSWREKLADNKGLPKTGRITGKMSKRWGSGTMVIPAPLEVDAIMRRVPKGRLITINEIRAALAKQHGV